MPEQKKPFIVIHVERALFLDASETQKYRTSGSAINLILDGNAASSRPEYFVINYFMVHSILLRILKRMDSGELHVGLYSHMPADKALHYTRLLRFLNVKPTLLAKCAYISASPHKTRKDSIDDFLRMRPELMVNEVIFVPSAATEVWKQLDTDLQLSKPAIPQPVELYVPPPLRPGYTLCSNKQDTAVVPKTTPITTMAKATMEQNRKNLLHPAPTEEEGTSEEEFAEGWHKAMSNGQEARASVNNRRNKNKVSLHA